MDVEKTLSADGLPLLGQGTTANVYALDAGRVLKVFRPDRDPEKIDHEWTVTHALFDLGFPCAQPLERVRVETKEGPREGMILERVPSLTLGQKVYDAVKRADWKAVGEAVEYYVAFAKRLHAFVPPAGLLPDIRQVCAHRLERNAELGFLDGETVRMSLAFLESMPETDHYLHGDLNPFNVPLWDEGGKMFDVGEGSVGDPLFEFNYLTCVTALHERIHPGFMEARFGFPADAVRRLEEEILRKYYASLSDGEYASVRKKAALIGAIFAVSQEIGVVSPALKERFRQAVHSIIAEYVQAL